MSISLNTEYNIQFDNLIKINNTGNNTIKYADMILENYFFLRSNLDIVDFSQGLDWDYKHNVGANTYQLYLHSLEPVSTLLNAFILTKKEVYLSKALEILLSWNNYQKNGNKNEMIWTDHAAASRTVILSNLLVLLLTEKNLEFKFDLKLLNTILLENINFLYSDHAYKRNNHGIMMDRALLQASTIFKFPNSDIYFEKALYRVKDNFYNSFSHKSVHLENSPEYHLLVQRLFQSIEDFLQEYGLTLGNDINQSLLRSNEYLRYILKPNQYLPLIGDTKKIHMKNINKNYDSFFDEAAGISVLQSKNKDVPQHSTWISFVSGYSSLVHKDYDDLSFCLFADGQDIFVDAGQHSYSRSKERLYVKSAKAHNTITVNRENYTLFEPYKAKDKIKLEAFNSNPIYDYVKGINLGYKDIEIERSILFIKEGFIFLLDKISSNIKHSVSQHFNLAPNINIVESNRNKTILDSNDFKIIIEQLNSADQLTIHKGDIETPYAIISEEFGKVTPIYQLEYEKNIKDDYFLTLISLNQKSIISNIQFNQNTSCLTFELNYTPFNLIL